jgi:pimeloyl-ACP methyl ester carboxylesterase
MKVATAKSVKSEKRCSFACVFFVIILCGSLVYFGACYVIITSDYVQAMFVYSHYVKDVTELHLSELHKIGLPQARNINIFTEDGLCLKGWHLMNPAGHHISVANQLNESERNVYFERQLALSERVVVYFHGNSHTRGQVFRMNKIKQIAISLDAHVIAFDYRGFADSEGFPSEHGTYLDARAVVHYVENVVMLHNPKAKRYLINNAATEKNVCSNCEGNNNMSRNASESQDTVHNQPRLYLYGHSLGAAISTSIAIEFTDSSCNTPSLAGLILDSPFTALSDALRNHPLTAPFRVFPFVMNYM